MALLLGIDTGGTFTDAALLDNSAQNGQQELVAKAKSLTTRHDLSIGIAGAAEAAIKDSNCQPEDIKLVSVSTTLATNALVEGQGGRVALIAIGFDRKDLEKAGLADALGQDPVIMLPGGHTTHGAQAKPLDLSELESQIEDLKDIVTGFAVAGYFAVRNPEHEITVRDYIFAKTGKAVTCSHELSARLNGPKRALTTVLNARLVPMITRLIEATHKMLAAHNIAAPVMVVRGDGALVSAEFAKRRPIETILSGPAASLVGARYLTGADKAFVNDIGGTTSDIAILEDGRPKLDPDGAMVGGFRTMVEAVAMHTFGLGGDSEVGLDGPALRPEISLGPKRLAPISLIAKQFGEPIHAALDQQLKSVLNGRHDGRFAMLSGSEPAAGLSVNESKLFERLSDVPQPLEGFLQNTSEAASLNKLVGRGLVLVAGLTPSDAMHALDHHDIWDKTAALKALQLFARRRDGSGNAFMDDPLKLAERIIGRVQRRSAEIVLQTAFEIEGRNGADLLQHELVQEVLDQRSAKPTKSEMVSLDMKLDRPLIGLGASAHQYHPKAADLLNTTAIVPEHADVANAIGAVVGQISVRFEVTISQPAEGRFQVTGLENPFAEETTALKSAEEFARLRVTELVQEAGAHEFEISISTDKKRATLESRDTLVEATVTAVATGRPPIID